MVAKKKKRENVDDLNRITVPLMPLRGELAKISKEGITEYPLGELILIIQDIVRSR